MACTVFKRERVFLSCWRELGAQTTDDENQKVASLAIKPASHLTRFIVSIQSPIDDDAVFEQAHFLRIV
jgi:hypothetical protein